MEQTIDTPPTTNGNGVSIAVIAITVLIILSGFTFLYYYRQNSDNYLSKNIATNSEEKPTPEDIFLDENTETIPTPTKKILRPTGPGQFACSANGDCKDWDLNIQKQNCTQTYADRFCLDQCGDITKRCKI